MYVGRILPNDSLRVRFGRPSKGRALDKGSSESDDARPPWLVARSFGRPSNTLRATIKYEPRIRPIESAPASVPGASEDGRIPGERGIPEKLQQLHRPHPERARRDARIPQLLVRGGPRTGRNRPARGIRIVLIRCPSRSASVSR